MYVAPSFDNVKDESIFEAIEMMLDDVHLTKTLRKIEDANRSAFGPRSIAKPWEDRKASLSAYFDKTEPDTGFGQHGRGFLRPISWDNAVQRLIPSSSAGLPYMLPKRSIKGVVADHGEENVGVWPCVLFTRTQEQGKTRNIWGYPVADTVAELQFFKPWLEFEQTLSFRAAIRGPGDVDRAITTMLYNKRSDEYVMCLDFSQYDASVEPRYSKDAFAYIASQFQRSYEPQVVEIFHRFISMPIVTPDGVWEGFHGVPSGSAWTNTVDSLVQYQCAGQPANCQIQGDDGVYVGTFEELRDIRDSLNSCGLTVNDDKTWLFSDEECVYLQRYYSPSYKSRVDRSVFGGVYSIYRAFLRLKYLERWTDIEELEIPGKDYFSLRAIMILENCKHHPAFEDAVRFAYDLDAFNLAFDEKSVSKFQSSIAPRIEAGATPFAETGIDSFETLKVLRSF